MTTVLVTGSNRGIGLELCRHFAARGDDVIAVCRRPSQALENLGVGIIADVDVSAGPSMAKLGTPLHNRRL